MNKVSPSKSDRLQRVGGDRKITYPQVFYPAVLQSFLQQQQLIYPEYQKPSTPKSIWDFPVNRDVVKLIGGMGLFILGWVVVVQGLSWSAIALGLLSWGGVIWGLWQLTRWWEKKRREYQSQYETQLRQWKKANKARDRYLKNAHKHQQNQLEQRQQKLTNLLRGKVEQPRGESEAQKGVSEASFLEVLKTVFPEVKYGGQFPIPGSKLCYSIDLEWVDVNTGLSIDIEIDEPYAGKSKQPHHCLDDNTDRNRNQFFNDRNWVVIRFAEEQVVKNPQGCCRYLAERIFEITQDLSLWQKVQNLPSLESVKAWTFSEAKQLAIWKYREQYLHKAGIYSFARSQK